MGNFLHSLGERSFRHKWWFIGGWITMLLLLGSLAVTFYKAPGDAISIPGTEAQKTLDRFATLFPDAGKGTARVVFEAKEGRKIADVRSEITSSVEKLSAVAGVSQVVSPFTAGSGSVSKDGTIAYATIQLEQEADSVDKETVTGITAVVDATRSGVLTVEMGGDVINRAPGEILGIGEVAGVLLALVVLVMTLGSLVAAGLPIIVAIVTILAGMGALFGLSQIVDITATTPVLAVMLGLAVGIDYSLFIINKYRHYLLQGYAYNEAIGKAIATAGNAVLFAAATVVIALSALTIVQIPFMSTMGLAGAGTVALAALVAVTLLPALLGVVGNRVFRGKTKRAIAVAQKRGPKESHTVSHKTVWYKWGEFITKRPIAVLASAVIVVGVIAIPAASLTLGLPTDEHAAVDTTERKAYDILERGFGAGFNAPLIAVVENMRPVSETDVQQVRAQLEAAYATQVAAETAKQTSEFEARAVSVTTQEEYVQLQQDIATAQAAGVARQAEAKAQLEQQITQYSERIQLSSIAEKISELDLVEQAIPALVTDSTKEGVIQIVPKTGPSDEQTIELITKLRDKSYQEGLSSEKSLTLGVTGSTALQNDINTKLSAALPLYLSVVVGLSLLLLVVVFRSILIPIKATLGFLLSVLAMFGAMVAVFQWGWFGLADAAGPIVSFIPIISIGVLFGLAMDYEFFLVSSMHEEFRRTKDAKRAVVNGFGVGSRVVAAAGIIMVAVFAGFITNHDATIQTIGFGLAIGVLIDAFIVRMMIVPAVMVLLGKSAWWLPRWLDRVVPHVSIEGDEESAPSQNKSK